MFLTSTIVTLLTFAVSSAWDLLQRRQQPEAKVAKADEKLSSDPDRVLLEPEEAVDADQMVVDMLNFWDGSESEASTENTNGQSLSDADDGFLGPALCVDDETQEVPHCAHQDAPAAPRQHIVEASWGGLQPGDCPQEGYPEVISLETWRDRGSDGGLDGRYALRGDGAAAQDDQDLECKRGQVTTRGRGDGDGEGDQVDQDEELRYEVTTEHGTPGSARVDDEIGS